MSATAIHVNVEDKLFQNRYKVDHGRPHIKIKDTACLQATTASLAGLHLRLPGQSCYKAEGNRSVTLITDGCLECGSCRVICTEHTNVAWEYPRGGHGILFKFG